MRQAIRGAAVGCALIGGVALLFVAAVTLASVLGRWLQSRPVPGDIELVQLGTAAALALFLPYCQLHGSHLIIDIFTARAATSVHRRLDALAQLTAAAVLALLAVRCARGVADLRAAGEVSMVLGLPLWVAYAPMVPALALAAVIAAMSAFSRDARPRA